MRSKVFKPFRIQIFRNAIIGFSDRAGDTTKSIRKCFYSSKHVRGFFNIVVWSIWLISICLTCIIANDNAKLHTIQKKYVLLREFARLNQEWADKADYIEFLYTDEAEHQEEIERLWENRHKRLAK